MKKKWIEAMQYADDKYIEEADPTKATKGKRLSFRRTLIVLTACVCLSAMLFSVFVIVPYFRKDDISRYKDSEYYMLIQKLDQLNKEQNQYTNGIPELDGNMPEGIPPSVEIPEGDSSMKYEEITDNQVDGIIEGDRIKRSDKYVYYLSDIGVLYVYSIAGDSSEQVGRYKLNVSNGTEGFYATACEIYLSKDCKTVTVMMPIYSYDLGMNCLRIKQLDVSDPASIKNKSEVTISGYYESSRLIDGNFLVMTHYNLGWDEVDYDDEATFVPGIEGANGMELISPEHILMPDKLTNAGYTVVALIDGESMETRGFAAFLSYSEELYVSSENIFATIIFEEDGGRGRCQSSEYSAM